MIMKAMNLTKISLNTMNYCVPKNRIIVYQKIELLCTKKSKSRIYCVPKNQKRIIVYTEIRIKCACFELLCTQKIEKMAKTGTFLQKF